MLSDQPLDLAPMPRSPLAWQTGNNQLRLLAGIGLWNVQGQTAVPWRFEFAVRHLHVRLGKRSSESEFERSNFETLNPNISMPRFVREDGTFR